MKLLVLAALLAVAAAQHGAARGGHGHGGGYGRDYDEPRPYHFEYAVDDPHYGPMMAQTEQSDGAGNAQGYYSVNLPDGRTQHVRYVVDGYKGFNAEVSYDGAANHPQRVGYGHGGHGPARGHGRGGAAHLG